jgi:hypothetical protein
MVTNLASEVCRTSIMSLLRHNDTRPIKSLRFCVMPDLIYGAEYICLVLLKTTQLALVTECISLARYRS